MCFPADREIYSGKLTCKNLSFITQTDGRTGKRRTRREPRNQGSFFYRIYFLNILMDPCVCIVGERGKESPPARTSILRKKDVKVPFFKKNYLLSFHSSSSSSSNERRMKEYIFIYLFIIIITKMIKGNADPLKWLSNAPPFLGIEFGLLMLSTATHPPSARC